MPATLTFTQLSASLGLLDLSSCSLVSLPSIGGMSALFTDDTGCATMGSPREVTGERAVTGGAAAGG